MSKLYAVSNTQKSPQQEAHEAMKRYREKSEIDYARVRKATIRVGAGMRWLPSEFRFWWNAPVERPKKGEIQRKLYGAHF